MPEHAPITGNAAVEAAAIAYVIEREAAEGRTAVDTRHRGAAADLISGDRVIEVKAFGGSGRGESLWLEVRQVEEARTNARFWLYLVTNVRQGDPSQFRLLRIGGERLQRLLRRAKEQRYYTVPLPVAVYDELMGEDARREPR